MKFIKQIIAYLIPSEIEIEMKAIGDAYKAYEYLLSEIYRMSDPQDDYKLKAAISEFKNYYPKTILYHTLTLGEKLEMELQKKRIILFDNQHFEPNKLSELRKQYEQSLFKPVTELN